MASIIECVPNVSEGRDNKILESLRDAVCRISGVSLRDVHSDSDHNRSVFTFSGSPEAVAEAAFALAVRAVERIDLRKHSGVHPRMGAIDVIPFVPVRGVTIGDCVIIARQVGERIARELDMPVFLYEAAAALDSRRNLADIRRGGFEGMAEKLKLPEWKPDYGQNVPHPTAGVTAVGARKILIAFNINLDTADVRIAKEIAKAVRESSGGLKHCKAIGIYLKKRKTAQVSMNLTDYEQTPIYRVFEAVSKEAAAHGVRIAGSELVGLAPSKALLDCAEYFLLLENFSEGRLL